MGFPRNRTFCLIGLYFLLCSVLPEQKWNTVGLLCAASSNSSELQNQTWSLTPLIRPPIPLSNHLKTDLPSNPIDLFIRRKLKDSGLNPSGEAKRRTLIRRVYFDLIGLPPDPHEINEFIDDQDPLAYQRLVDRLLGSPAYGERWARHWLDIVHYGDTHGYDKDKPRPNSWPYRDYLIRSFNQDKPYHRFVKEQIAGDFLYPYDPDALEATGFISAGPWDFIGHAEVSEEKIDGKIARNLDRDDMVRNTFNTFVSVTVQCARCHSHKFDPLTQTDYYRLQAVFSALDRADSEYDRDPETFRLRVMGNKRLTMLKESRKEMDTRIAQIGGDRLKELNKKIESSKGTLKKQSSQFGYHSEIMAKADQTKWVQIDLGKSHSLKQIAFVGARDNFNNIGEGFGFPSRFKIEISTDPEFETNTKIVLNAIKSDFPNPGIFPQKIDLDNVISRYVRFTATRLALRQNDYIFALAELSVFDSNGNNLATGGLVTAKDSIEAPDRWQKSNLVDGYFFGAEKNHSGMTETARLITERQRYLKKYLPETVTSESSEIDKNIEETLEALRRMPTPSKVYTGKVHTGSGAFSGTGNNGGTPRIIRVLKRGDVTQPAREVHPGTLPFIPGFDPVFKLKSSHPEGARRKALANWIVDERNPLTWRSIVNRIWQYHFGKGLVDTPNDFGKMGKKPTHPQLLDWLAVEFRDSGQSLKRLHRLMVTSATYRQKSETNASNELRDSGNRFLWRMNRRRLEAEPIRDTVLQLTGKLRRNMYGPAFKDFVIEKPEHSPHYQYHLYNPDNVDTHRRSVYRFLVRSQQNPFMQTLDCADPSQNIAKRDETVTPLQALAMLNNPFMTRMSEHFAERLKRTHITMAQQIGEGFFLTTGRHPNSDEMNTLLAYAEHRGLVSICRVLFNLNEFIFVD